jgi:uracil-DNA glycosylase
MRLHNAYITSVVRCAPPANKPTPEELRNCAPWLDAELAGLTNLRVVVCLGKIAFDGLLAHLLRTGRIPSRAAFKFAHGAEYTIPAAAGERALHIVASYHPSLQNTNTGKLTRAMFLAIFQRAQRLAQSK